MTDQTAPAAILHLANRLELDGFEFTPEHVGGGVWVLVQPLADGDLVVGDDSIARYAGADWADGNDPAKVRYLSTGEDAPATLAGLVRDMAAGTVA